MLDGTETGHFTAHFEPLVTYYGAVRDGDTALRYFHLAVQADPGMSTDWLEPLTYVFWRANAAFPFEAWLREIAPEQPLHRLRVASRPTPRPLQALFAAAARSRGREAALDLAEGLRGFARENAMDGIDQGLSGEPEQLATDGFTGDFVQSWKDPAATER